MDWYYLRGGQQIGPVSDEEIRRLVASGLIQPPDLVWREGLPDWQPAGQTAGLFTLASTARGAQGTPGRAGAPRVDAPVTGPSPAPAGTPGSAAPPQPGGVGPVGERGMPPSVIVVVASLGLILAAQVLAALVAGRLGALAGVVVTALVLVGMVKRHRLAWQWGRYGALLGAVLWGAGVLVGLATRPPGFAAASLAAFLVTVAVLVALGRPSATAYFRLVCPACQAPTKKAADFLFTRARCSKCQSVW